MLRPFVKYEGLGNDFLVLEADSWPLRELASNVARVLCDRHTGIGGDGLLWVGPGDTDKTDAEMVILNADGSRPEMCGNGVRCVAAYLHHQGHLPSGRMLRLQTDAGVRFATVPRSTSEWATAIVEVDMGMIRVEPSMITVATGDEEITAVVVDAGNPHAVIFQPVAESLRMEVVRKIEARYDVFPQGVNVEFVALPSESSGAMETGAMETNVHERGVGWTQACGTGACAVAAVAVVRGIGGAREGHAVAVRLDGGVLEVTISREGEHWTAWMSGPARRVYNGRVQVPISQAE